MDRTAAGSLQVVGGLVGLHGHEQFTGFNPFARGTVPGHDRALGHGLTEFGHQHFDILHADLRQ